MVVIWCFAQPQNEDFSFDTDLVEINFFIPNRNLSLQVVLYDPLCWRTTEELYQAVRQFSGYFTTGIYFYKYHVQWSESVSQ